MRHYPTRYQPGRLQLYGWLWLALIAATAMLFAGCPTHAPAQERPRAKRVLYVWTMDGCLPCEGFLNALQSDADLQAAIATRFDLVQPVPFEDNRNFAFGITAFPTFCVDSPTSPQRIVGYTDAATLCRALRLPYKVNAQPAARPPAERPRPVPSSRPRPATTGAPAPCFCPRCDELARRVAALETELRGAVAVAGEAAKAAALNQQAIAQIELRLAKLEDLAGELEDVRERVAGLESRRIHVRILTDAGEVADDEDFAGSRADPIRLRLLPRK